MSAQPRLTAATYRKTVGRPLERTVQVPLVTWIRDNVSACSWHTRNESLRHDLGRIRDADEGVLKGVADLVGIIEYGPRAGCMFAIEVKRPGSTESDVTKEQRRFGRLVVERGGVWTWVDNAEAAKAWCQQQGIVRPRGWAAPWVREPERHAI